MGSKPLRDLVPVIIFLLLFAGTANAKDEPVPTVAIRDVTVLDMRNENPQPGMTVLIREDRIATVGKQLKLPGGAEVVEGNGKFLIPGLWDNYTFTLDAISRKLPYSSC